MKRILIPTDFSPCAKNALQIGAAVARATGAEVLLLHILYSPLGLEKMPAKMAEYPEVKAAVTKIKSSLKKETETPALKGIKVDTRIDIGTPAPSILLAARKWNAELIVIGSHGVSESDHPFVGSNAQKVLRGAECPVLSVQKDHTIKNPKQLTFASSFDNVNIKAFEKILVLAKALKAGVHLLHVNTPVEFNSTRTINSKIDAFEKNFPRQKFTRALYSDSDVHTGVAGYLSEHPTGMVALMTKTRHRKPSYTLGVTESVAYHSPVPVLSVNI
jgi:nucleotide-binding universal stress UspA family protein